MVSFCDAEGLDINQFYRPKTFTGGANLDFDGEAALDFKHSDDPDLWIWGYIGGGDSFDIHMQEVDPANLRPMEIIKISTVFTHKIKDAFRVKGDSMYPIIRHGAIVGVDFKDKSIVSG